MTPLSTVKDKFSGRAKLVEQLAGLVDKQRGDSSPEEVKSRLMGLSNAKLLRLYKVEQAVRERFGDRAKLVAHVLDQRKKAGYTVDDAYKAKLDGFTKARLLDLSRQKLPARAEKTSTKTKTAKKAPAKKAAKSS